MSRRTWSVQLNLDDLNAAWMVLREPGEKAEFLDGLTHGLNLSPSWAQGTPAYSDGFKLGHQSRTATEEYRERQALNGKLGGRPKKTTALAPVNHRLGDGEAVPKVTVKGFVPGPGECNVGTCTPSQATSTPFPPSDPAADLAGWGDDVIPLAQLANGRHR